jgi:hypothetical protein
MAGQAGRLVAAGPAAPLVWLRAGPEAIEDYDVVVTNYDSSFNFTIRTYYLLDTVVHATVGSEQRSSPELDRTLDRYILT